jgi:hypothetical protein
MKQAVVILASFILSCSLHAQANYKVIKVNGDIEYVRTGDQMELGDVFAENEALSFGSPGSRAAVINPEKGRFILTSGSASQLSDGKSYFLPAMSNISTRGGALNSLSAIQDQFADAVAILYEASWHVNPYQFPLDDQHFFFLQFNYMGEQINKKLSFRDNNLVFSREEILKVDDQPISSFDDPAVNMHYYSEGASQYISSFNLVFPQFETFKMEAGIILEELDAEEYSRKVNELSGYVFEFYGKPDKEDIMLYMEKDFGLVK